MRTIILSLIILCLIGCAKRGFPVPYPVYPPMKPVALNDDGSMSKINVDNTVYNMLEMQQLIDILYLR